MSDNRNGSGRVLTERLSLEITGTEGHDLTGPCVNCDSSDAFHVHIDTGVCHCFSCEFKASPFDLAEKVLGSRSDAGKLLVELGMMEDRGGGNGQPVAVDPIEAVARLKACSVEGLKAYGATAVNGKVAVPMFDADGERCSTFTLDPNGGKGLCAKGKPSGVFLPNGRLPASGARWGLSEGVKDSSVLFTEFNLPTVGMNGCTLAAKFSRMFAGVHLVIIPDRDGPSEAGAQKTTALLYGCAASVKRVSLPAPFTETHGADVRDVLRMKSGKALIEKALLGAQRVGPDGEPVSRLEFQGVSLPALDQQEYRVEYLINRCLVADQPGIIGGAQKTLKTTIAVDMAVSLVTGQPFLGHFGVNRCANVAFMSGEGGLGFLQEVARRVCHAKQVDPRDFSTLVFCDRLPRLTSREHLDALGEFLTTHESEVVFVDPVYLCLDGADAGNVLAMGERLSAVNETCRAAGVTPILLHHTRKNIANPFAAPQLQDLSWSGFAEFAGQWWLIGRRVPYEPNERGCHELWINLGSRIGHAGLWGLDVEEGTRDGDAGRYWSVAVVEPEGVRDAADDRKEANKAKRQEKALEADRKSIVQKFAKFPDGETKKQIREHCGFSGTRFNKAFASLLQDDMVLAVEVTKGNNQTYDGFKLNPERGD